MNRMCPRWAAPLAIAALALAGCATTAPGAGPDATLSAGPHDPRSVLGTWTITGTGSADDGHQVLIAETADVTLPCGTNTYGFVAGPAGEFGATFTTGDGACDGHDVTWLTEATSYSAAGTTLTLRDGKKVLAVLTRAAWPAAAPPQLDDGEPPDMATRLFPARPPLPAGLTAPTRTQLARTWHAPGRSEVNRTARATFDADGTWSGSDGCNGLGGLWVLGEYGWFVTSAGGIMTLRDCDNIAVDDWVDGATQVGLAAHGTKLVFLGRDGKELGHLTAQP